MATWPRARPGRSPMPEEERRQAICEAAAVVFIRDGYTAASMDDVARGAAMSKRTLYRFFASKAALFEATISDSLAPMHLDPAVEREPDMEMALTGILEASGRHLLTLRPTGIFRLVIAEVGRSPELAESFHRVLVTRGASALQRLIATGMGNGRLKPGDADATARMLYGMAFGSTQIRLLLGVRSVPTPEEIAALARDAVAIFLHGARRLGAWSGGRMDVMPAA
ncbi:MAG: TetR/AcrR family transcriptional regulator [Roseococcus sp.]